MPKTRGAQPPGVKQQTASRTGTRTKKDAKSLAREEEKENIGRQTTTSRQHRRSGVLGATTTSGVYRTAAKPVATGVKKRKPLQVKEKKLPLQDITSQFLPAPESTNRGIGSEDAEHTLLVQDPSYPLMTPPNASRHTNLLLSPLPPSSPPPDLVLPTVEDTANDRLDDKPDYPSSPDITYDTKNDRQTSSSSDPFGFAALERKLKEERKFVTNVNDTHEDDDIYEDPQEILVADTSSPRPVRRIKHSLARLEGERLSSSFENQHDAVDGAPVLLDHPHFSTPPTPHKDKHVHRRLSCEGIDIFSPCSSSLESSPSPTKTSGIKRRRDIQYGQDPLEEFNAAVDESGYPDLVIDKRPTKRPYNSRKQDDGFHNTSTRILRPRRPAAAEKAKTVSKPLKVTGEKSSRKAKSNSSKKVPDVFDDDDLEAKWNQEREARIKYFHSLAEYSVEKENVHII